MKNLQVNCESLNDMLRKVQLGNIINECMLSIRGGRGYIEAIDITNSLIAITDSRISEDASIEDDLGLGNLELLIKFISTLNQEETSLSYNSESLTISRKDNRRRLKYLLTEPSMIATRLAFDEEDKKEETRLKLLDLTTHDADLTYTVIKDLLSYMGVVKQKDTSVFYNDEKQMLSFIIGGAEDHKITLELSNTVGCRLEDDPMKSFSLQINGEHLSKIFQHIDYNEDNPPIIFVGAKNVVAIEDGNNFWALYPTASEDDQEALDD